MKTGHIERLGHAAIATLLLSCATAAAEEHRQLGAHVHGAGKLEIAVEGRKVSMTLEAPGADIVGFEHVASSDPQRAAATAAAAILAQPLDLFRPPVAAGCTVTSAKVDANVEDHDEDDDKAKDASASAKSAAEKAPAEQHDHEHEGHSEYRAAYAFDCAQPGNLTGFDVAYFAKFPGAQKLTVSAVSDKGQTQFEVSRAKPFIDLAGVM